MTPIISSILTIGACILIFTAMVLLNKWLGSHDIIVFMNGKRHHIYAMKLESGWKLLWETRKCVGSRKGIGREFSFYDGYQKYWATFENRDNYFAWRTT
jgi:hypothetical protein